MVNIKFIRFIDLAWMIIHYSDYSSWSTSIVYSSCRPGWLSITCVHYCRQGGFDPQGMVMCHHAFQSSSPLGQHKSSPETEVVPEKTTLMVRIPVIPYHFTDVNPDAAAKAWSLLNMPTRSMFFHDVHTLPCQEPKISCPWILWPDTPLPRKPQWGAGSGRRSGGQTCGLLLSLQ